MNRFVLGLLAEFLFSPVASIDAHGHWLSLGVKSWRPHLETRLDRTSCRVPSAAASG